MKKKINDKGINQIIITLDMSKKNSKTIIASDYSAWDSLFIAIEGVALLAKLSKDEGVSNEALASKFEQLKKALVDYDIRFSYKPELK